MSTAATVHKWRFHNPLFEDQKYRGHTTRCKPLISSKNQKARLEFARKYRDEWQKFWKKVLWADETKSNLYQSDGKAKMWRKKGSAYHPRHTTSSVKQGGDSVLAWACMAASRTGSFIFIDDVTHYASSRMNSEVYWNKTMTPKHTANTTKDFIRGKKWTVLDWLSQSLDHKWRMQQFDVNGLQV